MAKRIVQEHTQLFIFFVDIRRQFKDKLNHFQTHSKSFHMCVLVFGAFRFSLFFIVFSSTLQHSRTIHGYLDMIWFFNGCSNCLSFYLALSLSVFVSVWLPFLALFFCCKLHACAYDKTHIQHWTVCRPSTAKRSFALFVRWK